MDRENARKDLSRKEAYLYQGDRKTVNFLDTLSDVCDAAKSTEREIRDHVVEFSCNILPPSMMNKCLTQQEFAAATFGDTEVGNRIPNLQQMRERLVEHETKNNNLARSAAYDEPTVFVKQQKAKSGRGVKAVNTAAKRKGLIRAIAALDLDNNNDYNDDDEDEDDTQSVASVTPNGGSAIQKLTQEIDQMKDQFRQVKASMVSRDEMKEEIKKANDDLMKSIQSLLETQMSALAMTVANQIQDNMRRDAKEQNKKNKAKMEANHNKNKATRRCWKCNVMGHIPADNVCKPEDIAVEDGKRSQPHNPADISCAQPSGRRLPRPEKIESEQPALTNEALMAMMQTLITVMRACTPSHIGIPCLTQSLYRTLRDTTNQNHGAVGQTTTFVASPLRTGQHLGCTLGVQTEDMGTPGWERQVPPKQSATQTESSSLTEDDMVGNREGGAEASAHDHWAVTRTRATNYERPSPEGSHSGASTTSTAQCRVPVETAESREPQSEQGEGLGSDKSTVKLVQTTSTIERDPSVNKASYDAEFDHPTAPQIKLLELARKWRQIGDVLQRRPHPDVVKKRGWECVTPVARVLCVPVANVIEKALRSIRNRSKSMFDRPNTLGDGEQSKTDTEGFKSRWIERTVDNGSYVVCVDSIFSRTV